MTLTTLGQLSDSDCELTGLENRHQHSQGTDPDCAMQFHFMVDSSFHRCLHWNLLGWCSKCCQLHCFPRRLALHYVRT